MISDQPSRVITCWINYVHIRGQACLFKDKGCLSSIETGTYFITEGHGCKDFINSTTETTAMPLSEMH